MQRLEADAKIIAAEIGDFKSKLAEKYDKIAPITASKADSLLMKLKYLKFQTTMKVGSKERRKKKVIEGKDPLKNLQKRASGLLDEQKSSQNFKYYFKKKANFHFILSYQFNPFFFFNEDILLQKLEAYDYV